MGRPRALAALVALLAATACAPRPAFRMLGAEPSDGSADVGDSTVFTGGVDAGQDAPLPVDVSRPVDTGPVSGPPDRPPPPPDLPPMPMDLAMEAAPPKTALFVVGSTTLESSDAKIKAQLEGKHFTVKVVGTAAPGTSASGTNLVVISASNMAGPLAGKYTMATVPVIVLEPAIYDDMKMTGNANASGETPSGTQIVVTVAHPIVNGLAVGMPATVATAATPLAWGEVMAGAGIAALMGSTTKFTVFAYEAGVPMAGGLNAPARRVGLFVSTGTADRLTPTGWQIFDGAVDWATGK
jgi:hypothetical protein